MRSQPNLEPPLDLEHAARAAHHGVVPDPQHPPQPPPQHPPQRGSPPPRRRPLRVVVLACGLCLLLLGGAVLVHALLTARRERVDSQLAAAHAARARLARTAEENVQRDRYRAELKAAVADVGAGRLEPAREALQRCPEALRQFEWGLLDLLVANAIADTPAEASAAGAAGASPRGSIDLEADGPSVNDLAVSADGRLLATASDDGRVRLYELADGTLRHTFEGHSSPVLGVRFAPDGRRLASCSGNVQGPGDASIRIWDTETGAPLAMLVGHESAVCGVAFSADGARVASVSGNALSRADDTLRLWDIGSGECVAVCTGHTNLVSSVEFSPDGRLVATGSFDDSVRLWEAESGRPVATLAGHSSPVLSLAFSPDGAQLASGSGDPLGLGESVVRVWDVASRAELTVLSGHRSGVFALAWSPDGRRLVSGSGNLPLPVVERAAGDTSLRIWDAADGAELLALPSPGLPGSAAPLWELAFTPDGRRLIAGGDDGRVRLWFSRAEDAAAFGAR